MNISKYNFLLSKNFTAKDYWDHWSIVSRNRQSARYQNMDLTLNTTYRINRYRRYLKDIRWRNYIGWNEKIRVKLRKAPRQWRRMAPYLSESKFHNWISIPNGAFSVTGIRCRAGISRNFSRRCERQKSRILEPEQEEKPVHPSGNRDQDRENGLGDAQREASLRIFVEFNTLVSLEVLHLCWDRVTRHSETRHSFFVLPSLFLYHLEGLNDFD